MLQSLLYDRATAAKTRWQPLPELLLVGAGPGVTTCCQLENHGCLGLRRATRVAQDFTAR
jgi:hypothetical protein